jgi:acyl carrier protein
MKTITDDLLKYFRDANNSIVIETENDFESSFSDLGIDSLDLMSVLFSIQDGYQIEIPDDDIDKLTTINSLAKYILEKQGN